MLRRITFLLPCPILSHLLLIRVLIRLKLLQLRRIHVLNHIIRLPFLKRKAQSLMRVVFVIRLIFMVLNLHEVRVAGRRIQGQRHETGNRRGLGDDFKSP